MTISNEQIAAAFHELADYLEANFENPYRVRAYRKAAQAIKRLSKNLETLVKEDYDLTKIRYIGNGTAYTIRKIIQTGKMPVLEEFKHKKSKSAKKSRLPEKKYYKHFKPFRLLRAVDSIILKLKAIKNVKEVEVAGSYRRRKEVISNLNMVVSAATGTPVIKKFVKFDEVKEVISLRKISCHVVLHSDIHVYLEVIPQISYGAGLIYHTGSKDHVEKLQKIAEKKKLKLTKAGLFKGRKRLSAKTEDEVYAQLGLPTIFPEMRENRGELITKKNHPPKLIELNDIKGDLHSHTNETDGVETLEKMAQAAIGKGYEYLAITDHSQRLAITHGLDKKRLLAQIKLIDKFNEKLDNFRILKSIEVDILEDGKLDLPNSVLKELDLTVCSVHSKFSLPLQKQTERVLRAMDNPYFNILGHATGRLIGKRDPYQIDLLQIFKAAKERNCIIELNAQPYRLDINDVYCQQAKLMGLKFAISSDAHSIYELNFMQLGVFQARRGWLSAEDVINTRSVAELKKIIKRK